MINSIKRGQNYLFGVFVIIVILQVITKIINDESLETAFIRISILFVLFYFLLKGYSWSKWILSIYLLFVGIYGIGAAWYLISNRDILPNNLPIGIIAGLIGVLYISSLIMIHMSKDIKIFLVYQNENRKNLNE